MRYSTRLTLVFLMVLYIGPMILAPSFISPSRQNEPNTVKDFAPSTEYTTSNQSITSFAETLPDDVLFYPDGGLETTTSLASAGSAYGPTGTYVDTQTKDLSYYRSYDGSSPYIAWMYLNFTFTESPEKIELSFYGRGVGDGITTNIFAVYNGTSFVDLDDLYIHNTVNAWTNITITDSDYWSTDNKVMFYSEVTATATTYSYIYCDYMEVVLYIPSMSDASFVETFTVIDDWEVHTGNTITTDGDIGTFTTEGDGVYNIYYCNTPSQSFENYYLEFRYSVNDTDADKLGISLKSEDSYLGDIIYSLGFYHDTTNYETHKVFINGTGVVESISILIKDQNGNAPIAFNFDYLRISPANESGGWQHDGSTIAGIDDSGTANVNFTVTTDGDKVTLNATAVVGFSGSSYPSFYIRIDSTTTRADIERDYYPFLEINITARSVVSSGVGFDAWVDGYRGNLKTIIAAGLYRFNIAAMSISKPPEGIIFFGDFNAVGDSFQVTYDWVKIFSIANFTVTQSGAGTDDILYTDSGVLYSTMDSGTIEANHDPALSFETNRSLWTMTTSSGTPQIDFYIDAAWVGYTSDTSGSFPSGTLTDLRLNFTDNANIEAITFLSPIPQWNEVGEAILYFSVPFDMWGYNTGLIILGLVMIPVSTIYLAYGIKHDRSSNRLFYGLIIFFLGFGLLIGGILP